VTAALANVEAFDPESLTDEEIEGELLACSMSPEYFIHHYVKIKHRRSRAVRLG